ncbi:GGDEF domain-containing protein [Gottschalkiaceae bacterium SANA]|nr:GGDEF domain-containing protein [Gottschalkiaceae bacterium SANA]
MKDTLYKQMLENMYEGVYFVDADRTITFWNKGAERISGYRANEMLGKSCFDNILNHVNNQGCQLCLKGCPLQKTIDDGVMRESPVYLHHKDGHRVPVSIRTIPLFEGKDVIGAVEVFTDETEQFDRLKDLQELRTLALKDQLTELPNRRYLNNFLAERWRDYEKLEIPFGIIFMDIDHFKKVNDSYGHEVGDQVLKMVGKSTRAALRRGDLVGRWGGEEFIIVISTGDAEALKIVAEKIRMLIEQSTFSHNGKAISVTVSLGATLPFLQDDLEKMIKRSDAKMYESKNNGRNQVKIARETAY